MTWSTRQLAEMTGVTLRSIRHWHDIGLLPEPERRTNGYKQYTARHLVLALRIARLSGLGFTLERIAQILASETYGQESLRGLRSELDDRIGELARIRSHVDELIDLGVSPDLSPDALRVMEAIGDDPGSRNIAIVLAHLIPTEETHALASTLREAPADLARIDAELRVLPADAPEAEVVSLIDRTVAIVTDFLAIVEPELPLVDGFDDQVGTDAVTALLTEHMNPAQRRVMTDVTRRLIDDREGGRARRGSTHRLTG